ncbi:MAG: ATP synthase F1 subunit epsilon [Prolixibacteraceae bacterium]|jgi:F-type H+-transporting ATPase subunit epsilon|nr:ATP synthase F1 subunit epsilon [Prolixibacteraceae bacterium]NLO01474.1 ATP synthase F1 subunit epsilon [Bacteroidales bacterium]
MFLEIISPDKQIYSGNVKRVRLPGSKGLFEILNNHAPIISTLDKGVIRIIDEDEKKITFKVEGGIVENKDNKIIVLVESVKK